MANKLIHNCPVCGGGLRVTRLHCPACHTGIDGEFETERLLALSKPQQDFVMSFILNRGNIREMEKELGISYPTVRARLDEIIAALGGKERPTSRRELLEQLSRGEITEEEAMERLNHAK